MDAKLETPIYITLRKMNGLLSLFEISASAGMVKDVDVWAVAGMAAAPIRSNMASSACLSPRKSRFILVTC